MSESGDPARGRAAWKPVADGMRVVLSGEVDYACREQLARALNVAADAMPGDVVVDVTDVTFWSSEALGFLARLTRLVVDKHERVVTMHNPGRATTRLVTVFEAMDRITVTRD